MNPFITRKKAILEWKSKAIVDIEEDEIILKKAEELQDEGIKSKDALHISCAIEANSEYFITTDKKLLNFISNDIKIVNPIEFINEMEDYNED